MIRFYYNAAPNPMKVALLLEELGLGYEPIPVDTRKGDQHGADYQEVNPNGKVPAIVDGDVTVFDSNAILLYLADKTRRFVPAEHDWGGPCRAVVVADVRCERCRTLLRSGSPLPPRGAEAQGVCAQPVRLRSEPALEAA